MRNPSPDVLCAPLKLSPSEAEMEATYAELTKEAMLKAKKLGVVSLANKPEDAKPAAGEAEGSAVDV